MSNVVTKVLLKSTRVTSTEWNSECFVGWKYNKAQIMKENEWLKDEWWRNFNCCTYYVDA